MANLPSQQKAVIFNTKSNALSFTTNAPLPSIPEEHLIKVHSTAITNGELGWAPFVNWPEEHVPCYDVSGTIITEVEGSPFKKGDKVFGRVMADREGTARQYATILPSETAKVPSGISMVDASSVPMSAHTAWQALFEKGLLTGDFKNVPFVNEKNEVVGGQAKGKRILVLGAAGGVGLNAVQFAKFAGAHVVGTASGKNEAFLKQLGADEIIDYTKTSVKEWINAEDSRKFDLVFDCVGRNSMLDGWNGVKDNGFFISVVPGFREPDGGKPAGVTSVWFVMEARGEELAAIGKFIAKGLLKTNVDSVWKIEEFEQAFAKTASGHARGKVVIKVVEDEK
jgi:NADPH:quinone reductase-like Zn-dependent oxidoreductase